MKTVRKREVFNKRKGEADEEKHCRGEINKQADTGVGKLYWMEKERWQEQDAEGTTKGKEEKERKHIRKERGKSIDWLLVRKEEEVKEKKGDKNNMQWCTEERWKEEETWKGEEVRREGGNSGWGGLSVGLYNKSFREKWNVWSESPGVTRARRKKEERPCSEAKPRSFVSTKT